MLLYTLHGTKYHGYVGIGDGDQSRGGYVAMGGGAYCWNGNGDGWFELSTTGSHSWLGRGLYSTTSYSKAKSYGGYIYLMEFEVNRLKIVNQWDSSDSWRNNKSLDGVYTPAYMAGGQKFLQTYKPPAGCSCGGVVYMPGHMKIIARETV